MLISFLNTVFGIVALPFKILFELVDPVLRFFEMALNIVFGYIFTWVIDCFAFLPSIGIFSLGEAILATGAGVASYFFFDMLWFFVPVSSAFVKILFCIGVGVVSYFVLYLLIHIVLNLASSFVSMVVVLVRLAIYLPASGFVSFLKIALAVGSGVGLWFAMPEYWHNNLVTYFLCVIGCSVLLSIIILLCRRDITFNSLGTLGDVGLEELRAFNHSIGIYIMTLGVLPVYIGRAVEFKNGGLRKRLRDYLREGNSARKHTSGRMINSLKDDLLLYVIELGHTEEDVALVENAESSLISNIFTKFNEVDSVVNYFVNVIGYILGATAGGFLTYYYLQTSIASIVLYVYCVIVAIVCISVYFVENSD